MYIFPYVYTVSQMQFVKHFPYARHRISSEPGFSIYSFCTHKFKEESLRLTYSSSSCVRTGHYQLHVVSDY